MALYPYNEELVSDIFSKSDLAFPIGAIITDIVENPNGWWEGCYKNCRGSFPSSFVSKEVIGWAKCTYTYYATQLDELNIKKGDDIKIYERRGSGWLRVICNGKGGLVPPTHVRELRSPPVSVTPSPKTSDHSVALRSNSMKMSKIKKPAATPPGYGTLGKAGVGVRKSVNAAIPAFTSIPPPITSSSLKATSNLPPPPTNLPPPPATTGPPPPATTGPPPMVSGPPPMGGAPKKKLAATTPISGLPQTSPASIPKFNPGNTNSNPNTPVQFRLPTVGSVPTKKAPAPTPTPVVATPTPKINAAASK